MEKSTKTKTANQPGGGDGEKIAGFRLGLWSANYRRPHLTRKRQQRPQPKEKIRVINACNVKRRPDMLVISVNKENRDNLVEVFFARMICG